MLICLSTLCNKLGVTKLDFLSLFDNTFVWECQSVLQEKADEICVILVAYGKYCYIIKLK